MDQQMLTYLKVALWLADCSPSLSHILAQCIESCVSCYPLPFGFGLLRLVSWPWLSGGFGVSCACLRLRGWG